MLNKKYRLTKDFQFRYVYRNGQSVKTKAVTLVFVKSRHPGLKIGISVSNKIGKAFFRNRVKRRIRESIRANLDKMAKGYNYVFVANNNFDFLHSDYSMILNYVEQAIEQANLIINAPRQKTL
ncbi:MAG TPA: ribonuclease P protein component [Clostridiales bacterium]|jgi:ribonuclease P protein component|nr:ribonuclease P protein component [Clostridiales bacterium]